MKKASRGRCIAAFILLLILAAALCACGTKNNAPSGETDTPPQTGKATPDCRCELEPSDILAHMPPLTVLDGTEKRLLASVDAKYPADHPFSQEMGLSSYSSSLLLIEGTGSSVETVYTFPADTFACAGTLYDGGAVITQIENTGDLLFDYSIVSVSGENNQSIFDGRCTEICGLSVLSDSVVAHAYCDSIDTLRQGIVVTSLSGEVVYCEYSSMESAIAPPLFCSDGERFAFCAYVHDTPTVTIGSAEGVESSFSLNTGDFVENMAFLGDELLIVLADTSDTGKYAQLRQLRSLDGTLICEASGAVIFRLSADSEGLAVGESDEGLSLIWKEDGRLGSKFIPMETAFRDVVPLGPGRFLIIDPVFLSAETLTVSLSAG